MVKHGPSKKTSITDVAKEAGVSITTVSRVVNKSGIVSKNTSERVIAAIEKLHYKPDISAKLLASKEGSQILGIVAPYFEGIFGSFYFSEILRGINSVSMKKEIDALFHFTQHITSLELANRLVFNPSFTRGLIFMDLDEDENKIKAIKDENLPFVVVNHYVEDISVHCIGIDNRSATINAINYFIDAGHRKIATVCGNLSTQAGINRLEGYKKALLDKGFDINEDYIVGNSFLPSDAKSSMLKLLNLVDPPTAVFVASDDMAYVAMDTSIEKGYKVPEDISFIGFDDSPAAVKAAVPLTTLKQPLFEMGKLAAELILQIIQDEHPRQETKVLLPTQLVIRQSCCKLL